MLLQLHWQSRDHRSSVMRAQSEIHSGKEFREWFLGVAERHPLPAGCRWLCVHEGSEWFWRCATEKDAAILAAIPLVVTNEEFLGRYAVINDGNGSA